MTTLVFGHTSPDTDSTGSPIVWAWYLNQIKGVDAKPVLLGEPNTEAAFMLEGNETKTLGPGESVCHPSNHPHATQTEDHPFLALVLWRGDVSVRPVLTYPEGDT